MRKYAGGFILLILSLLFVIGEQTVAGPCPVMPDGRFMVCYWAGQAVLGVGIVLVVLSLLHLAFKNDGMKLGLDLAVIADAALLMFIPNRPYSALYKKPYALPYGHGAFCSDYGGIDDRGGAG